MKEEVKNWEDLDIGDYVYYLSVETSNILDFENNMTFYDELILDDILTDIVIDKCDYTLRLENFGTVTIDDVLDLNSIIADCDDTILFFATHKEGIKNELVNLFALFANANIKK